ncbi:DUF5718 family protein [Photobacterium sp. TY1-4]|uniref:DUF5718 family protein n=1 Tax=Photobacterium sp. TY1-4 TaxID=2899122 RepID=UPI0021C070A4|nr:DUF5718 family protein [Photobacterium sp. TY1-4]UXI02396.1 DUF5718 family protein [Photobacterium sp. TY1-4]
MKYKNVIGFGIAGNFAGHLEQAGEAADFEGMAVSDPLAPKALFPLYVPGETAGFLSVYPFSDRTITPPTDADNLQIEPEVALICDITYQDGQVTALTPKQFGAFNDCSIRRPNALKISEKKNWGEHSKGLAATLFTLDSLAAGSTIDRFRIASFHQRAGKVVRYGEDCQVKDYSYFHEKLLHWIVDRMNHQQDVGPAEDISKILAEAGYPMQAVIAIGATRYTEYGETHFLQPGDVSVVVVYDGERYTPEQIFTRVSNGQLEVEGISALIQTVA